MNVLSMCTGYGGLDLAFHGVFPQSSTVAYCEIESFACANLISKMEKGLTDQVAPIWTDLTSFPYKLFEDRIDAVVAGFPCQPFSRVNTKKETTDSNKHLFPNIMRGVLEMNCPSIVFFENVTGILDYGWSKNGKPKGLASDTQFEREGDTVLYYCLREMERAGYYVTAGVFNCEEVGAPMARERVYLLGLHQEMPPEIFMKIKLSLQNQTYPTLEDIYNTLDMNDAVYLQTEKQVEASESLPIFDFNGMLGTFFDDTTLATESSKPAFPSGKGEAQYSWEPSRWVWGNDEEAPGIKANYADEMRILGNGVVPAQAHMALRVLLTSLLKNSEWSA